MGQIHTFWVFRPGRLLFSLQNEMKEIYARLLVCGRLARKAPTATTWSRRLEPYRKFRDASSRGIGRALLAASPYAVQQKSVTLTCGGLFPRASLVVVPIQFHTTSSAFLGDIKCSQDRWLANSFLVTCQSLLLTRETMQH